MAKPRERSASKASKEASKPGSKRASPARAHPKGQTQSRPKSAADAASRRPAPAAEPPERRPGRSDDADAFIPDPDEGPARAPDDLAEVLAEDFLESATRGNDVYEDEVDRTLPDEIGGPFVVTDSDEELAQDTDESNPPDAEPAARPRGVAGLVQRPRDEDLSEADAAGGDEEEDDDEEDDEDEDDDEIEEEVDETRPR
jgi:hypothetical protein